MNKDSIQSISEKQHYRMLIRNLRKERGKKDNEKVNIEKTNRNKSK